MIKYDIPDIPETTWIRLCKYVGDQVGDEDISWLNLKKYFNEIGIHVEFDTTKNDNGYFEFKTEEDKVAFILKYL